LTHAIRGWLIAPTARVVDRVGALLGAGPVVVQSELARPVGIELRVARVRKRVVQEGSSAYRHLLGFPSPQ